MVMTKKTLADAVNKELGYAGSRSAEIVEAVLESVKETLSRGEDVLISGFGKFYVNKKRDRLGRNPQTEEQLTITARNVVGFKCSRKLRNILDGSDVDEDTVTTMG